MLIDHSIVRINKFVSTNYIINDVLKFTYYSFKVFKHL